MYFLANLRTIFLGPYISKSAEWSMSIIIRNNGDMVFTIVLWICFDKIITMHSYLYLVGNELVFIRQNCVIKLMYILVVD